jgi:hypothetical protein
MKFLVVLATIFFTIATCAGWDVVDTGTTNHLVGLNILDQQSVWVTGVDGVVLHFDGTDWIPMTTGVESNLNDIAMVDETEGWVVGDEGTILHYHDEIWEKMPDLDEQISFEDLWVFEANNVYFVGYGIFPGGLIYNWDGVTLNEVYQDNSANLADMCAKNPSDIWVVGGDGFRLHYDGTDWVQETSPLPETTKLFSVTFDEDGSPLVGGMRLPGWDLAKIYKKSGESWVTEYTDYAPWMFEIDIMETVGFFVGKDGQMIEKTIFGWQKIPKVTTKQINEISLADMSRGWAVCDSGMVLCYKNPAIDIQLSDQELVPGDTFGLDALLMNPGPAIQVNVFVILEVYGYFYFWPSFSETADFMSFDLTENSDTNVEILPEFVWPPAGTGEAMIWGAVLDSTGLLGYDTEAFSWE